jgi:hypothetical protein
VKRKYGVLGFVAFLYQLLGILSIIGGLVVALGAAYYTYLAEPRQQLETLVPAGVGIIVGGLVMFGFGQLINLLRDVELNTRRSAYYSAQAYKLDHARMKAQAARAGRRRGVPSNTPTQPSQRAP